MMKFVRKLFGSRNERVLKRLNKVVSNINALEPALQELSDDQLKAKTAEFKQRLEKGETLQDILAEAFAVVREAARRTIGMRHFDVQLIGGMVLHEGNIAEMLTGEGKTLVATLPAYLNALTGKSVHIITVNDYLAQRDANWMRPIYEFLGLTVGINLTQMAHHDKQKAYAADITYGTNNEFGFDYLRDNMAYALADKVQRDLTFAIVDEVDSILIDEARTPLIISGPTEDSSELYRKIDSLIPQLKKQADEKAQGGDYYLDEKNRQAFLTENGHAHIEELLVTSGILREGESLYDPSNIILMHHVYAALRAHTLFQADVDYIVRNDQIIIVDEHTGRLMQGRRWSDGLHQAVEAKEKVTIQNENQTLASITFQNYFRLYDKLAGMTGTADTEAYEFHHIYGLEVVAIPPNKTVQRIDHADKVYLSANEKFKAIIQEIRDCNSRGQPLLVGTASIENSEFLSGLLQKEKIPHEVLNAKNHAREAQIIAQAGQPGAVTIATNMAGRGTDIVLGGNLEAELAQCENLTPADIEERRSAWKQRHEQVVAAGGLHVLGTERHESRRIDNQLRGRSGRQGDPGSSRFYLSLEDNLLRIFASDKMTALMQRIGVPEGEALESGMLTRIIENAQRKVEGHHFDIRKQLLEFDNVANEQRQVIYAQRNELMAAEKVSETILAMMEDVADTVVSRHIAPQSFVEQWNIPGLMQELREQFGIELNVEQWLEENENISEEEIRQRVVEGIKNHYKQRLQHMNLDEPTQQALEKSILLQSLDVQWKEHLAAIDHLRQGIHLRRYAQKNPKQEYKREAFDLFWRMLDNLKYNVVSVLSRIQVQIAGDVQNLEEQRRAASHPPMQFLHGNEEIEEATDEARENVISFATHAKIGRNTPCPCGSGKKYKQCHGRL